jgi:hypothetical protein
MNSKLPFLSLRSRAALSLSFGLAISTGFLASAANPVVNGDFESALVVGGVTNWAAVYVNGGPADFATKGRTTDAAHGGVFGAQLRSSHGGAVEAYLTQTVSSLVPGGTYAITNWMQVATGGNLPAWYFGVHAYLESLGGSGNVRTADATNSWLQFVITNTADVNGQIELRLHVQIGATTGDGIGAKWIYEHTWFDDVSMGLVSLPVTYPPYRILSFNLVNQTGTWTWESVSGQSYSILASPDLLNWSTLQSNIPASSASTTFTTNVSLPSPRFFRIHRP